MPLNFDRDIKLWTHYNIFTVVTCESLTIENGQVIYNAPGVTYGDLEFYYVDTMASFSC